MGGCQDWQNEFVKHVKLFYHINCGVIQALRKAVKVTYSVALVLVFLSADNENRQLEDLSLADFGRLPGRLLLSVRKKSVNKNFANWKLWPLLVL